MKSFFITDTITGAAWHRVVNPAVDLLDRVLKPANSGLGRTPAQIAISKAGTTWASARTALEDVRPLLEALPGLIVKARTAPDFTDDAKRRLVSQAIDETGAQLAKVGDAIQTKLTRIDEILRTASIPAKPGDTAADEARYAGAKTDLRMVLDAEKADLMSLSRRIAELLERALGDGDTHTVWVLAGTRWPADYIRTRDRTLPDDRTTSVLSDRLGTVLDAMTGGDTAEVRRAYREAVSVNGTWAIEAALGMLPALLEDVRDWTHREMSTTSRF